MGRVAIPPTWQPRMIAGGRAASGGWRQPLSFLCTRTETVSRSEVWLVLHLTWLVRGSGNFPVRCRQARVYKDVQGSGSMINWERLFLIARLIFASNAPHDPFYQLNVFHCRFREVLPGLFRALLPWLSSSGAWWILKIHWALCTQEQTLALSALW